MNAEAQGWASPLKAARGFSAITADAVTIVRSLRERMDVSVTLDGLRIAHAWNTADVCEALKQSGATIVVATLETKEGMRVDDVIAALRNRAPRIEVVVVCAPGDRLDFPTDRHCLVRMLVAGEGTSRDELRAIVARAQPRTQLRVLAQRIADDLTVAVADRSVVLYFIDYGDLNRSVAFAAAELGISQEALHDRSVRCTGLDVHEFRTWGRLVAAGVLLECTLWSADRIGSELGFGGGGGLCNAMKSYSGRKPSALREPGGTDWLVARCLEACRKRRRLGVM